MKAKLEFELPEDREDFETAVKGVEYRVALSEFYTNTLRKRRKYGFTEATAEDMLEAITSEYLSFTEGLEVI